MQCPHCGTGPFENAEIREEGRTYLLLRCIACGDLFDNVVLANRVNPPTVSEPIKRNRSKYASR